MHEQVGIQVQNVLAAQAGEGFQLETVGATYTRPDLEGSAVPSFTNEYAQLKQQIRQKGSFDPQPVYYTCKFLFTLSLLALSVGFLFGVKNFWLQLLNAAFLGFVLTQIGLLAHDIGHRQVFRNARKNAIGGLLVGNLLVGWSWSWWVDKHNGHHGHPNQLGLDTDILRPFTAFTEEDARIKQGFVRFMVKYQAYLEFPTYLFAPATFVILSIQVLLMKKAKYVLAEAILLTLHYVLYFGVLLMWMNAWQVVLFVIVHNAIFGLYLGSIVAPNHKGMPILEKDSRMDFLRRQVLTARNVNGGPLVDFWYGGLNYQVEHHLFPNIPRNKLSEAQRIVRAFCAKHSIAYHETGMLQSYKEILHHLHKVSAPLRSEKAEK